MRCDAVAKDEKALTKTLRCVISAEKLLVDELKYPDGVVLQGAEPGGAEPIGSYQSRFRKLVGRLGTSEGQTTIEGYINGDGVTFEFIFALRPDGDAFKVSGLLMHSEFVE